MVYLLLWENDLNPVFLAQSDKNNMYLLKFDFFKCSDLRVLD